MYEYSAVITGVYDGDTVTADIDLGFGVVLRKQKLRLLGINAPELREPTLPEGKASRDALMQLVLAVGSKVVVRTQKDHREKYGRWLATISTPDIPDVNQWLVEKGYAEKNEE